jgi:hypothetical protein
MLNPIKVILLSLTVFGVLLPVTGTATQSDDVRLTHEAEQTFKTIVALWKDERFTELYDYGRTESKQLISKQDFIRLMKYSNVRLQCCWAMVNNVKGIASSLTEVYVKATLGYEYFSSTEVPSSSSQTHRWTATSTFKEETFLLNRENGDWKIDLSDILATGGYMLGHLPGLNLPSALLTP